MKTIDTLLLPWEERALKTGRREGRQLGRDEGRQEGIEEGLRAALLELLEFRFRQVPIELRARLRAIKDTENIRRAQRLALSASHLGGFLAGFDSVA